MNTLTPQQQERIVHLLEEGKTLREVERITGHRRETISLYGRLAGVLPRTEAVPASVSPQALAA